MDKVWTGGLGVVMMFVSLAVYCACRVGDLQDDDDIQEDAIRKWEERKRQKKEEKQKRKKG